MGYTNILDWETNVLYPALYRVIDEVLGQYGHTFTKTSKGWESNTHLDGSKNNHGKGTEVTASKPGIVHDWGRNEWRNIVTYIAEMDGTARRDARKKLAAKVGVEEPTNENYIIDAIKEELTDAAQNIMEQSLWNDQEADKVRQYVCGRWGEGMARAMGIGYTGGASWLSSKLMNRANKVYTSSDVADFIKSIDYNADCGERIGTTHQVAIPILRYNRPARYVYRYAGNPGELKKYLYPLGKQEGLGFIDYFGNDKSVIVVESQVDAAQAKAMGLKGVVAAGTRTLTQAALDDLAKIGVKTVYLVPDLDKGKDKQGRDKQDITRDVMEKTITKLLAIGVHNIYLVELPDLNPGDDEGKTDVGDILAQDNGKELFGQVVSNALEYWKYQYNGIMDRYTRLQDSNDVLTAPQKDNMVDDMLAVADGIADAVHRDEYIKYIAAQTVLEELGIGIDAMKVRMEQKRKTMEEARKQEALGKLLKDVAGIGDASTALEKLERGVKQINMQTSGNYDKYLKRTTEADIKEREMCRPNDVPSGYFIGEDLDRQPKPWMLPAGALTVVAGGTGHGKTKMLINLAINAMKDTDLEGEVYYLTYEEDADSVTHMALNTYLNMELNRGSNINAIQDYYKTGGTKWPVRGDAYDGFIAGKSEFYDFLESGRLNIQYIDEDGHGLCRAIEHIKRMGNPGLILVDYIQFIPGNAGTRKQSRQEEVKEICVELAATATATGLPIVLGAQFNRTVLNRKEVMLQNLGEAGDIERAAHTVIGIWDGDFKERNMDGKDLMEMLPVAPGEMWVKILKRRRDSKGVDAVFTNNGNTGRIENKQGNNEGQPTVRSKF